MSYLSSYLKDFDQAKIGTYPQDQVSGQPEAFENGIASVTLGIGSTILRHAEVGLNTVEQNFGTGYAVSLADTIDSFNILSGRYDLNVSLFTGISVDNEPLSAKIIQISEDRTELLIASDTINLPDSLLDRLLVQESGQWQFSRQYQYAIYIEGSFHSIINAKPKLPNNTDLVLGGVNAPIRLKLSEPCPHAAVGRFLQIVLPFGAVYTSTIQITADTDTTSGVEILPPDFTIKTTEATIGTTDYKNYDDIVFSELGTTSQSLQRMLDETLSGSAESVELGIDYHDYKNFVFFGSALERLENFKYKLQKIEQYSSSMAALSSSNASASFFAVRNTNTFLSRSNAVISSFDGYEKYLYYNSSSNVVGDSIKGNADASTWPKTDSAYPFTNAKVDSADGVDWFYSQSLRAQDYDNQNDYSLEKLVPIHVRADEANSNYLTFVHMVGQHFDQLWTYVDNLNNLYDRTEQYNIGISKDLVYDALASLGWEGQSGYAIDELWSYYNGVPFSGSSFDTTAVNDQSPTADITKEIWNRTLNNLPYLLKTKGSERSIKALLATYGMPSTLLQIREYGGQSKEQSATTYYEREAFGSSLQFTDADTDSPSNIRIPWGIGHTTDGAVTFREDFTGLDTVECRIRPTLFDAAVASGSVIWHVFKHVACYIQPHPSASNTESSMSNHARLKFAYAKDVTPSLAGIYTASTGYLPIYDGDWWNVEVSRTDAVNISNGDNQIWKVRCAKTDDYDGAVLTHDSTGLSQESPSQTYWNGNSNSGTQFGLIHFGKNYSFPPEFVFVGDTIALESTPAATAPGFSGSMQELRGWHHNDISSGADLEDEAYKNHVLNATSIEGNHYTASFSDLIWRYPLGTDAVRHSYTPNSSYEPIISSSHPNQAVMDPWDDGQAGDHELIAKLANFNANAWRYEEEKYYYAMPDIVGNRSISDKIRIDNYVPTGQIYPNSSSVSSSIALAGPDSPLVSVNFSPSHEIDLDIASQLGGTKTFDDFVGNPRDRHRNHYKELRRVRLEYWKKYGQNRPTFATYLNVLKYFDKSLFKQIELLLPARSRKIVGLEVRPTLLERNTVKAISESFENRTFEPAVVADNRENQKREKVPHLINNTFRWFGDASGSDNAIPVSSTGPYNPGSYHGSTIADLNVGDLFGYDYRFEGTEVRDHSQINSNYGAFFIGDEISHDVPVYTSGRTSKKFTQYVQQYTNTNGVLVASGRISQSTDFQDFSVLDHLKYEGAKFGTVDATIGGVINYTTTDPDCIEEGIIPGIKSPVEVILVNPNTPVAQANNASVALPPISLA